MCCHRHTHTQKEIYIVNDHPAAFNKIIYQQQIKAESILE